MDYKERNSISVLMVGIGGYGFYYLKNLYEHFSDEEIEMSGVVDPFAVNSGLYREIKRRGITICNTLTDFYNQGGYADLVVISSPMQYHIEQSCIALRHGSNVLCDKPLSTVIQDIDDLLLARKKSGRWIMIGYQWSYSNAIQELKRDIISGRYGKPIRMKSLCFWPRGKNYYERNQWAGKLMDNQGRWVLDSPLGNAMAHFIHNLFYLLGMATEASDQPAEIQGECYRTYSIQNYDTGVFRAYTSGDVEILFYGSHVTACERGPMFHLEFEDGTVTFGDEQDRIVATTREGRKKDYGSPEDDDQFLKLHEAMKAVRKDRPVICGPEAATAQVLCINGVQDSVEEIAAFPVDRLVMDEKKERLWIDGLGEELYACYRDNRLPSEENLPWAVPGKIIDLRNYVYFPGGRR